MVLYDAVFLLHEALETLTARNIENKDMSIDPIRFSCINKTTLYAAGSNIVSVMQEARTFFITSYITKKW